MNRCSYGNTFSVSLNIWIDVDMVTTCQWVLIYLNRYSYDNKCSVNFNVWIDVIMATNVQSVLMFD